MTANISPSIIAQIVNAYWAKHGVDANARVEPEVGLVSDLVNGLPRGFDPERLREPEKKTAAR